MSRFGPSINGGPLNTRGNGEVPSPGLTNLDAPRVDFFLNTNAATGSLSVAGQAPAPQPPSLAPQNSAGQFPIVTPPIETSHAGNSGAPGQVSSGPSHRERHAGLSGPAPRGPNFDLVSTNTPRSDQGQKPVTQESFKKDVVVAIAALRVGESLIIGRGGKDVTVQLPQEMWFLDPEHLKVERTAKGFVVTDLSRRGNSAHQGLKWEKLTRDAKTEVAPKSWIKLGLPTDDGKVPSFRLP